MKKAGLLCSSGLLLFALSCGHPSSMVSMAVTPANTTVIGIGDTATSQYTAYGTYIHPTETRDVTKEVTWTSSIPAVATINNGVVTPAGMACGITIITATAARKLIGSGSSEKVVTAASTFTVADPNVTGCPKQ